MSGTKVSTMSKRQDASTDYIPSLMLATGKLQINPEKTTQMLYKIKLPLEWWLDASEISIPAGRGQSAFAHKLFNVKSGGVVVVLARPLDSYVPTVDCVTTDAPRVWTGDCMQLKVAEYRRELRHIRMAYAVLEPLGATPKLYHHEILPGTTENYGDERFNTTAFGVQVWEAWDMSLQNYILKYKVTRAEFEAKILLHLLRKCNQIGEYGMVHGDLHYGNVVVKVADDEVVDIAFIDLAAMRNAKQKVTCTAREFMDEYDFTVSIAADGLLPSPI